jgi:hypothetical protein
MHMRPSPRHEALTLSQNRLDGADTYTSRADGDFPDRPEASARGSIKPCEPFLEAPPQGFPKTASLGRLDLD